MADPDGISIMGYSGLPSATVGSALYVLAFEANMTNGKGGAGANATAIYTVWSIAGPASLVFGATDGSCFHVVDMLGDARPSPVCAKGGILQVDNVTDAPLIVKQK